MLRYLISAGTFPHSTSGIRVALAMHGALAITMLHPQAYAAECNSEKQDLRELLYAINGPEYDDGKGCLRETALADYDERMASFYRECGAEIAVTDPARMAASHESMARSARQAAAMACQLPDR